MAQHTVATDRGRTTPDGQPVPPEQEAFHEQQRLDPDAKKKAIGATALTTGAILWFATIPAGVITLLVLFVAGVFNS